MKIRAFIAGLSLLSVSGISTIFLAVSSQAATINATSCSLVNVQSAINSAASGDTIRVPVGNCSWSGVLSITKGITLTGAGIGATVITSALSIPNHTNLYLIEYTPSSPSLDAVFEMSGFEINGAGLSGALEMTNGNGGTTPLTKMKIHDNKFWNCTTRAINDVQAYGVVYSNQFINNALDLSSNFAESDGWNSPYQAGSAQTIYFEDNTFTYTGSSAFLLETGHGGRMVFRHNTVVNYPDFDMFDSHGNQAIPSTDDWRSNRGVEIYHNTLGMKRASAGHARAWYHRGGEGMMFNNTFTQSGSETGMDINLTEEDGWRTDWGCPCGPPGYDTILNTYIWNNTFAGAPIAVSLENPADANYIALNAQYWLPAKGTETNLPATCTDNSFYGTTDTDKLYKCHPANTWTLQYQPFTYPHPLRGGSAQAALYSVKKDGTGNFLTIQACATAAKAGDTCVVYAGTYTETVILSTSGTAGNPITFQANAGDSVVVQGWNLGNQSYITIGGPAADQGFEITGGQILGGTTFHHIILQNNNIHDTSGRCIQSGIGGPGIGSSFVSVLHNTFNFCGSGSAQGALVEGHHWLFDGNTFTRVEDGIAIYGDHHILRNNHFGPNTLAEVGPTVHPDAMESSCAGDFGPLTRMLFENNVVQDWGPDDSNNHTLLLRDTQSCGQSDQIIRFNSNVNNGSYFAVIQTNSKNVRLYNNSISRDELAFGSKEFQDIAFQENSPGGKVINNILADGTRPDNLSFCYWQDANSQAGFVGNHNVCWMTGYSGSWSIPPSGYAASDQFNQDPKFVSPTSDLHLQAGSPAIRAGGPLTTVASTDAGSGTSLVVNDAGFFQDGYGITGVQADWVRIGPSSVVQIISINYNTNTLTLISPITRSAGDPVYLYKDSTGQQVLFGSAPDIGAFQTGAASTLSSCDVNSDGSTNVADVQLCVNQAIGAVSCSTGDINKDGSCNVIDVQRDVNAALGGACVSN